MIRCHPKDLISPSNPFPKLLQNNHVKSSPLYQHHETFIDQSRCTGSQGATCSEQGREERSRTLRPPRSHVWSFRSCGFLLWPQANICHIRGQGQHCCWQYAMADREHQGRRSSGTLQISIPSRRRPKKPTQGCPQRSPQRHRTQCQLAKGTAREVQQVGQGWLLDGLAELVFGERIPSGIVL